MIRSKAFRVFRSPATSMTTAAVMAAALMVATGRAQESVINLEVAQDVGGTAHQFRGMGDFDGDGDVDLLSYFNGQFAQLRNDGSGGFTVGTTLVLGPPLSAVVYPSPLVTIDLDGDVRPDFVAAYGNLAGGLLSSATFGAPTPIWSILESAPINALVAGDFNGDGLVDVAVVVSGSLKLWLAQPTGPHLLAGSDPLPFYVNSANGQQDLLRTADVDGDGKPEILAVGSTFGFNPITHLRVYGAARGVLALETSFQIVAPALSNIAPMQSVGDIDGDADLDVVIWVVPSNYTPPGYHVLRGDGAGTLVEEPYRLGGPATAFGDYDGDGDLDGICCGGGGGPPINQQPSTFEVSLNDGTGIFAPAFTFKGRGSAGIVGAADLDGDGDRELVAGVSVFWNRGNVPAPTGSPFAQFPIHPGNLRTRQIADIDADGDMDYALGLDWAQLVNDGAGGFVARPFPAPPSPPGAHLASNDGPVFCDVDGDGAPDLLARLISNATGAFVGMRLYRNLGDGTLVDGGEPTPGLEMASWNAPAFGTTVRWSYAPERTFSADLDGDGDWDFITGGQPNPSVPGLTWASATWMNLGNGTFAPGSFLPNFEPMTVADVTGDGLPDLIGHYSSTGAIYGLFDAMVRNVGGTFAAPLPGDLFPTPSTSLVVGRVFAVDVDADGDIDVVRNAGAMMLNDGAGNLVPGPTVAPNIACVVDLDDDAFPEIISGQPGLFEYVLWRRTSASTPYASVAQFVTIAGALDVQADWDGDGDLDLASVGIRNARHHGVSGGGRLQYGQGLAGLGGHEPLLGLAGAPREGLSGALTISGGVGGATGFLAFGATPLSLPLLGGTLYVEPIVLLPLVLSGAPGVAGVGRASIPWTLPIGVSGLEILQQAAFGDPAAAQGVSFTRALKTSFGG